MVAERWRTLLSKSGRGIEYIGVGVGAVILNEEEEVLLLLRKNGPEAGYWTIPGGAVEWFETCHDAIKRECREELGLEIEVDRLLAVVDHIVKEDRTHWVSMEYLVRVEAGFATNRETKENEDLKWFSLSALPARITEPTREAVRSYLQMLGREIEP